MAETRGRELSALVVGAGFGGLAAGRELRRRGVHRLRILEQASSLGGVWRDNRYPGAACDVPSSLYSYSFASRPDWPRRYAEQPDILRYLQDVAEQTELARLVETGTQVERATWDDEARQWVVTARRNGTTDQHRAEVLVWAVGQLSRPLIPDLPGAQEFRGPAFHSARWDRDVDLAGRRVAVVGTGASAIQFVPHVQRVAGHVTVFQRSAPYVVPKPDRAYRSWHHAAFRRAPLTQAFGRELTRHLSELLNHGLAESSGLTRALEAAFRLHLRAQVRDPALRAKLMPDYPVGCKRLLFSNDWYPALTQPNVTVVTDGVAAVRPDRLVTDTGETHQADVVIYGTGFRATEFLAPVRVEGRGGTQLSAQWSDGARAHLGITVPRFPNMFLVYGPNTNLGGSSIVSMIECQTAYLGQALEHLRSSGSPVEVRSQVAEEFDRELQARLARTVWAGDCSSWYRASGGRITTNWPGTVAEYRERTARFDPADHRDISAQVSVAPA